MPAADQLSPKRSKKDPQQEQEPWRPDPGPQTYTTIQGDNWVYAKGEVWIDTKQAAQAQGCDVSEYCWVIACLRNQQSDKALYLNFCPCKSDHGDMDSAVHERSLAARQDVAFQAAVKPFIFAKSKDGTATSITSRQPASSTSSGGSKGSNGKGGKANSRRR